LRADVVADHLPGGRVEGNLPGRVDQVARADGLGVGPYGAGRFCRRYYFSFHDLLL
jgi:hypothetical protein